MKKLKTFIILSCLAAIAIFVTSCGATAEEPTVTAAPADAADQTEESEPFAESQTPLSKSEVPRISAQELKQRLDDGEEIIVADTRGETTFGFGHIAGAVVLDENDVESQFAGIPLDQTIVLYCS